MSLPIFFNAVSDQADSVLEANAENNSDIHGETLGYMEDVSCELINVLKDRIGFLERQLENEQRAHAELRRLLAGALERIPELEPAKEAPTEPRESSTTPSDSGIHKY